MFLELVFYGLIVTTMFFSFVYMMALLMLMVTYGYSYWIIKHISVLISITIQKKTKIELMRDPSPPNEIKVHPLIPCTYLDTFLLDGRCKYLDTTLVLDGGVGETRLKSRKLMKVLTKLIQSLLCFLFICTACVKIGVLLGSRIDYGGHIHATIVNLQLYSVSHLKLAQLLLDGDVESNPGPVTNTPISAGRPKKSRKFNFKPKKLNFTPVVDNRFLKQSELIHLHDIKCWSNI